MDIKFEQKVREKAYEIWMAAGQDGAADAHWIAAEQSVLNETVQPKKASAKKPAAKPAAKVVAVKKAAAPKAAKAKQVKH